MIERRLANALKEYEFHSLYDYIVVNDLETKFSAIPTAGMQPLNVQFIDSSSGNPNSWFWDFGDGGTSTREKPRATRFSLNGTGNSGE